MLTTNLRNTIRRLTVLGFSLGIMGSTTLGISATANAAEYQGQRLDGRSFSAIALALDSDQTKDAKVTFSGYQALVRFEDGSYAIVELEDVVIDDRNNITVVDRRQNVQWKLDLQ